MKRIDITDKLTFSGSPEIIIMGQSFPIDTSAANVLSIIDTIGSSSQGVEQTAEVIRLLFGDRFDDLLALEKDGRKLSVQDLEAILEAALDLIREDDDGAQD